jgi:GNAT superfamily N-acetyltransferase
VLARFRHDAAYLWLLGVAPEARGTGLARSLVAAVKSQGAASGFSSLLLKTEQPANVPIYEHLGLTRVAYTEAPPLLTPSWVLRSGAQA